MKLVRAHWKVALAVVWSAVAVVELAKTNYLFGTFATVAAIITFWDYYRRDRRNRAQQALRSAGSKPKRP
jgi:hypothetical protein